MKVIEKLILMKKYMEEINSFVNFQLGNLLIYDPVIIFSRVKIFFDQDRTFANWLITTFANLRWWPIVFYKFLVYLFIT